MSIKLNNVALLLKCLLFTLIVSPVSAENQSRWYTSQQLDQGKIVFQNNCAVCHGKDAESTPFWKEKDANGYYPPPPLNGSAHAWHHSLDALRKSVREGGQKIGGLMPPFENTLHANEIDAAIAFFQSYWSDELYLKWSSHFSVPPILDKAENEQLKLLKSRLKTQSIQNVKTIANEQLLSVEMNGQNLYLTPDGRYAISGQLIDLKTGQVVK